MKKVHLVVLMCVRVTDGDLEKGQYHYPEDKE